MDIPKQSGSRLELETMVLHSALIYSWLLNDPVGLENSYKALSYLYPDLVPMEEEEEEEEAEAKTEADPDSATENGTTNYYRLLNIHYYSNQSFVRTAFHKRLRKFLSEEGSLQDRSKQFFDILNAGIILGNGRLRISHDMVLTVKNAGVQNPEQSPPFEDSDIKKTENEPLLLEMLLKSKVINDTEISAIQNQLIVFPDSDIADLILRAGYMKTEEMEHYLFSENLIAQGFISIEQFSTALEEKKILEKKSAVGGFNYQPPENGK